MDIPLKREIIKVVMYNVRCPCLYDNTNRPLLLKVKDSEAKGF